MTSWAADHPDKVAACRRLLRFGPAGLPRPGAEEAVLASGSAADQILGILQRTPDLVLVRRDEGLEYHFFGDAGRRLLTPPGTKK